MPRLLLLKFSCPAHLRSFRIMSSAGYHLPIGCKLRSGQYLVSRVLGEGGFGITYLGKDQRRSSYVAIKESWPEKAYRKGISVVWPPSVSPRARQWQLTKVCDEAVSISKCFHPNVVRVHDWFEENETAYIVMEFIEGRTLTSLINKGQGPSPKTAKHYFLQLAEALQTIHDSNILHRDIKPDNIIINQQGRAKLIDFGAAKEFIAGKTREMSITLTPGYAPIEQYSYRSKRYPATDIYSLCATMYHTLTGAVPTQASERCSGKELLPPSYWNSEIDPLVERAILDGMKLQIEERTQTTTSLIQGLAQSCYTAKLVAVRANDPTAEFLLDASSYLIGNQIDEKNVDRECCIDLKNFNGHSYTSEKHASIFLQNGQWYIKDLNSTNGTYIKPKGQPSFSPKLSQSMRLNSGDELAFGKVCMVFKKY